MSQKKAIRNYYNQLSSEYDDDRFNNSYGKYIHFQERQILKRKLKNISKDLTLDMGCGTGRFLEFAHHGVDFSEGMLSEAKLKYPDCNLTSSDISNMPFDDGSFQAIYSLHVFMHLDINTVKKTIDEAHRILQPNGILIFDFPSKTRRKLINYQKEGWHGNTELDMEAIKELTTRKFNIEGSEGVLFFPIHRIPKQIRSIFRGLDSFFCKSPLKHLASYNFIFLRKIPKTR